MSRTVRFSCYRYFKVIYIVAGILLSNEDICETVDQIQIAPRVEMKEKISHQQTTKKVQRLAVSEKKSALSSSWYHKFNVFRMLNRIKSRIRPQWSAFSVWTIPNYFIQCSSNLLYRTFVINSDCDLIYK
ncbi:uncharacterized protein LOC135954431 [Calliphora vicina]|uniref:uncharacterized protein LOC135954431 n=1 Tax=Calliphora vicina TaxID=7373 RepID=UPI00325C23CB